MKARWIIENFTDSEDYRMLAQAVKDSQRDCFVIGKHNHFDFDPSGFTKAECIVVQGSIQMTKNIRDRLPAGCRPVAYNTWDNFLCSKFYPPLSQLLFNDRHEFTTVQELKADRFKFYHKYGKEALIFVRPDSGEKTFSGQLLDLQDFDRFWNNAVQCNAKDTDVIVVSTPKTVVGEWRFLVSNVKQIIAQSTYQYQGKRTLIPSAPVGATQLCHQVLELGYFPDPVFCVDVCQDADGRFWLLELTSFSSAGLYAMDKNAVVAGVSAIAEQEWELQ